MTPEIGSSVDGRDDIETGYGMQILANIRQHKRVVEQPYSRSELEIVLPPHREWPELATLGLSEIMDCLTRLSTRCATARESVNAALLNLETHAQFFLHTPPAKSSEDVAIMLNTYTATQSVGRAIFQPQEAYRNAIAKLSLLVADLIEHLPRQSAVRKQVAADFKRMSKKANETEDVVRKVLLGLVSGTSRGDEKSALSKYMESVRVRFHAGREQETQLKKWAGDCVGALL